MSLMQGRTRAGLVAATLVALLGTVRGQPPEGSPVALNGQTILTIRTSLGPFSAEDRARAASDRLERAARDLTVPVSAVRTLASDTSTDILIGDRVLFSITDADARAAG